jgi:hypothetical protein
MLCIMYFITYVDRVNIGTAASEIQRELHLTNTQLGLVFSPAKPAIVTLRRAKRTSPVLLRMRSDRIPPRLSPITPAKNTPAAARPLTAG